MIAKHLIAILWVGRYPVRDFTMYIHRRAEHRSGKLAGYEDLGVTALRNSLVAVSD